MPTPSKNRIDIVKLYFQEVDQGRLPAQYFTPNFEFYFPKFGVGRGLQEFGELATGIAGAGNTIAHRHESLSYIDAGDQVIVEGATHGTSGDGVAWNGGETPGGRFCSIFDFNGEGLIARMYVYADPDYASADEARFYWRRAKPSW
jgi:SnoaL-like domain